MAWLTATDGLHVISIGVPLLVFFAHAILFWGWIVDDAGISFAYARNLAEGHGLVSQPGFEPVEGYSNPLWVALLAPIIRMGIFDPVFTPKLLSFVLVGTAFVLVYRSLALAAGPQLRPVHGLALGLPLLLLSLNTSFVVWTTSGLENPLFVLEISLLLYLGMRAFLAGETTPVVAAIMGLTAAAAALTRPDGVILALAYPLLLVLSNRSWVTRLQEALVYGVALAVPVTGFLTFRVWYFGELYPNTYYAKGGATAGDMDSKLEGLRNSVLGFGQPEAQWLVLALVAAGLLLLRSPAVRVAGIIVACAMAGVLLMQSDWMRENRFFSAFIVAFYALAALEVLDFIQRPHLRLPAAAPVGIALAGVVTMASVAGFAGRSADFSEAPTVPMSDVQSYFGDRFEDYALLLGVEEPSVLTLDIGGLVYGSDLRVYDLVGLTDRTIARTLQQDEAAFHDYVLEELKPTFIHTHGLYAVYAALDRDPRFRVLYRPICEQIDPWVENVWRFYWYSGDYVRWDVAPDDAVVKHMESSCRKELPYPGN